jgi:thiamine biosynthesis lipoprotein
LSNNSIDRRLFLKAFGAFGFGMASRSFTTASPWAGELDKEPERFTDTRLAMGTYVSIILVHTSEKMAREAMDKAFGEIHRLSKLMNHFDDDSSIGLLNRQGRLEDAPQDIVEVIAEALKYYELTDGMFDISIKPVIDLFKEKFSGGNTEHPTEREIKKVLNLVGSHMIELNGRDIRFEKPGMSITLDGIAKGFIVDKASSILLYHNIENHLINAGGDIKAMGLRIDGKPWKAAIQDPMKKKEYLDTIYMSNAAVATSGNYENYFDNKKMFHHIANPRTGLSPVQNSSVSVIAPTAMEADALATSLMVMSSADGISFINSMPEREALIISRGNHKKRSGGWESFKQESISFKG